MNAGPVGQVCPKCSTDDGRNAGYWMIGCGEAPKMKILDSLTLAQMFWGETITAKADLCYNPFIGNIFYILDETKLDTLVRRIVGKNIPNPMEHSKAAKGLTWSVYCMVDESAYEFILPNKDNRSMSDDPE